MGATMRAVLKIEAGVLNGRLIGRQRRFERVGGRHLGLILIAGDEAAIEEIFVPRLLGLSVLGLRRIAGEHGLGLLESRFERTGIQCEERRVLLDVLAFGKVNRAELPGHLRANLDRGQRLGSADRRDGYRDGLLDRMRRDDRDRSAAPASAIASTAASPASTPAGRGASPGVPGSWLWIGPSSFRAA